MKKAFTLLEVMLAVALTAIVSVGVLALLRSGVDAWFYGQSTALTQETATQCMETLIEGVYHYDGLREILEITDARDNSISFIAWWEQKIQNIVPKQRIPLEHPLHPLASFPIAQVWSPSQKQFVFTPVQLYQKNELKKNEYSFAFTDPKVAGSRGRIFFQPDPEARKHTEMTIFWDSEKQQVLRSYRGKTDPLIKLEEKVSISDFHIEYLNSANSVISKEELRRMNPSNNAITAMRLILTASSGGDAYTLRSFVNIRKKTLASEGSLLTEGAELLIPSSKDVKTLSLIHFLNVTENSSLSCSIRSKTQNQTWGLKVQFTMKEDVPWISHYDVEFPIGRKAYSLDADIPADRGINLLTVDRSGLYDYDEDDNAEGQVFFEGKDIVFQVDQSSIGGVQVLVR